MRIRQGNDFIFLWAIERNGLPEDFSNAVNIRLHFKNFDRVSEVKSFQIVDGNIVRVEVSPEWASRLGAYSLILSYAFEDESLADNDRKCVVDVLAFNIVPKTSEADDLTEMAKTTDIMIGLRGLSAYEVWLKDNPESTKEDYYNWLRQPATDAVSLIEDKIETLDTAIRQEEQRELAEGVRLSNEQSRVDAEELRELAEADRETAEGLRVSAETARINAEGDATKGRVKAENERVTAETSRKTAEGLRVDAEILRQSSESERSEAEGLRVEAETLRFTAESSRKSAESLRVDDEILRQTAEELRVSGEVARNTAEGIRVGNESTRVENEGIRLLAEEDRVDAEETRVGNETLRINAELLREDAESDREDAEQLRQTNTSTAIQNANEATQSANNAAELANTKAGEANTATINANDARDNIMPSVLNNEEVQADVYAQLNARITALEAILSNKIKDRVDVTKEFNIWGKTNLILYGNGASTKVPDFIGQTYIDTTNRNVYIAVGVSNAGNWKLV